MSKSRSGNAAVVAHTTIAVIPPVVVIERGAKANPTKLRAAAHNDAYAIQQELYRWMTRRKHQGRFVGVDIMTPAAVNDKLARNGFTLDSDLYTSGEMAEILGVDLVVMADVYSVRLVPGGVAMALVALTNTWSEARRTSIKLDIIDVNNNSLWSYDWSESNTFGTPQQLVNELMRKAGKKMPYASR